MVDCLVAYISELLMNSPPNNKNGMTKAGPRARATGTVDDIADTM